MNHGLRIPTLLGFALLLTGLGAGVFLVTQGAFTGLRTKATSSPTPKNITVANISSTQASIIWETGEPAMGFVQTGPSPLLGLTVRDDRDPGAPASHNLHFVTLQNLLPNTTYYYKITSGGTTYPSGNPLSFKTASEINSSSLSPLIGTVVDANSQPVSEALVTLTIPGAQPLATITRTGSNFILPLSAIYTTSLEREFKLNPGSKATLTISDLQTSSRINLSLPFGEVALPPIVLGKDLNLESTSTNPTPPFSPEDLNKDGVVNSLDRIMRQKTNLPVK